MKHGDQTQAGRRAQHLNFSIELKCKPSPQRNPIGREANGFASRIGMDRQADRQTEREADRQTEDRHYDTLLNTHAKQLRNTNPRCACILDPKIISRALSIMETY